MLATDVTSPIRRGSAGGAATETGLGGSSRGWCGGDPGLAGSRGPGAVCCGAKNGELAASASSDVRLIWRRMASRLISATA